MKRKGKLSLTFIENGLEIARWNTHGYHDLSEIHYHVITEEEKIGKSEDKEFKQKPPVSRRYLRKLDKMSASELREERKKYEQ